MKSSSALFAFSALLSSSGAWAAVPLEAAEVSPVESVAQVSGLASSVGVGFLGGNNPHHLTFAVPGYVDLAGDTLVLTEDLLGGDIQSNDAQTALAFSLDRALKRQQRQAEAIAGDPQRAAEINVRSADQLVALGRGSLPATLASLPGRVENVPANVQSLPGVIATVPERVEQAGVAPALGGSDAAGGVEALDNLNGWRLSARDFGDLSGSGLPADGLDLSSGPTRGGMIMLPGMDDGGVVGDALNALGSGTADRLLGDRLGDLDAALVPALTQPIR